MKLVSIFQEKYDLKLLFFLLPFGIYFYIFRDFLYDLFAGSFIFTYFVLLLVLGNRYFLELLKLPKIKDKEWHYICVLKTLKPNITPTNQLRFRDVLWMESMPFIVLQCIYFMLFIISKYGFETTYFTNSFVGVLLLNHLLLYKNIFYIGHVIRYHKEGLFFYTKNTIQVYYKNQAMT